jgi:pimeloyl-ACP methyl ester carboxylesterase
MAEPAQTNFDDLGTVRDVTASGVRLRVVERGTGPKLLLLHSLFMDHSTWNRVAQELARVLGREEKWRDPTHA